MASNHLFLPHQFNAHHFNIPHDRNTPPNSWQPVANASLTRNQLQDNIYFFEIPSSFNPVQQAPPTHHHYSTAFTAQQPLSPPSRPTEIAQLLFALGAPAQQQRMEVEAQAQIPLSPYQTGITDHAAMTNYLLQQGFTMVPQPVASQPPQSMVAQPQLRSASASQPIHQLQPTQPQPATQPQITASSFLMQHLQQYPLQQLEPVVAPSAQPQLLSSSALYAQMQQQHQQQFVAPLPLLTPQTLHTMPLDELKKQEQLLQDLIQRSTVTQQPSALIQLASKRAKHSDPFPISVHQSPQQKRSQKPITMPNHHSVHELPALQKLAALQTHQIISHEKLRPIAPVAPSLRLPEAPLSLNTDSRLLSPKIPSGFLHPNPGMHHHQSASISLFPTPITTPASSLASQLTQPQSQKVPFANPVSISELPPWHSLSPEAQRNIFLNQNVILGAARLKEEERKIAMRAYNRRKKAEGEERSRREQEGIPQEDHATRKSWRKDGVPLTTEQEKQRSYYAKRKLEKGLGPAIIKKPLTLEEKRAKQRARNRAWRDRNYVRVIGEIQLTGGTESSRVAVARFPGQLNVKTEPIDDEPEPMVQQIQLEVRRELSDLKDQSTSIAAKAERTASEHQVSRQLSPKTPEQRPILDTTPLLASLLSQQRIVTRAQPASPLSPPPSLSYEASRAATRPPTQDRQRSNQIQPPSLLLQDQRELSGIAQSSNDMEIRPPFDDEVGPKKKKNSPIKCDRLNKAVRSYYERKKIEQGLGPVRQKVILTEDERRAKRTAACRAWRVKNYVKIIGEFPKAEAVGRRIIGESSRHQLLRNIKQEPLDETEELSPSADRSRTHMEDPSVDHPAESNTNPTSDADPWNSPSSSDYSVEL